MWPTNAETVISNRALFHLQVTGVIVLGIGIWLVADQSSFIGLLKSVEHEHIQVR